MRVLCVRRGDLYGPEYVSALKRQVEEFITDDFVCLTDGYSEGRTRQLATNWPGWWAKMELFAPWNEDLRPALYLDLDTIIVKPVNVSRETFAMLDDFNNYRAAVKRKASGVMLIPKDTSEIWESWDKGLIESARYGDGEALEPFCKETVQDIIPGVVSYKLDRCHSEPKGSIICFHGKPKPHDCGGWAEEYWRERSSLTRTR